MANNKEQMSTTEAPCGQQHASGRICVEASGHRWPHEDAEGVRWRDPDLDTPEVHHDRLMKEIDHEIDTYGVASLAGLIASVISDRCDTDDNSPSATHYRTARMVFEDIEERLSRLARPFELPRCPSELTIDAAQCLRVRCTAKANHVGEHRNQERTWAC